MERLGAVLCTKRLSLIVERTDQKTHTQQKKGGGGQEEQKKSKPHCLGSYSDESE